jgi:hypothetical protein
VTDDPTDAVENGNAIPETRWLFRRIYIWVVTVTSLLILAYIVHVARENNLTGVAYGLIGLVAWVVTVYVVAPSVESLVQIVMHLSNLRRP